MPCPNQIAEILLEIVRTGILHARARGWEGNAARSAIESDHIHNLPSVIACYSEDGLRYYWEVERVSYLKQSPPGDVREFQHLWARLEEVMQSEELERLAGHAKAGAH